MFGQTLGTKEEHSLLLQSGPVSIDFVMRAFWEITLSTERGGLIAFAEELIEQQLQSCDPARLVFRLEQYQMSPLGMALNHRACQQIAECILEFVRRLKAVSVRESICDLSRSKTQQEWRASRLAGAVAALS